MLTLFGKALRKLRIDRGLLLKNMADDLGYSSAFLSAIETGRKKIPEGFLMRLISLYSLSDGEAHHLKEAAEVSVNEICFNLKGLRQDSIDLAVSFAKRFDSLSDEKRQQIVMLLKESD